MRSLTAVGLAMMVLGIAALAVGVIQGEVGFVLLVIIPVIYGSGLWALLGGLLIFLGIAVTFFSSIGSQVQRYTGDGYPGEREYSEQYTGGQYPGEHTDTAGQQRKGDFGGVVLIGPIPILFGSWKSLRGSKLLLALMMVAAILFAVFILANFLR